MTVAPSRDLVVRELAVEAAAYVIGLVVLSFVPALPAGQLASLLIGLAIFLVVYLVLYWLLIRSAADPRPTAREGPSLSVAARRRSVDPRERGRRLHARSSGAIRWRFRA